MKRFQLVMNLWAAYVCITGDEDFEKLDEVAKALISNELNTIMNLVSVWTKEENRPVLQVSKPKNHIEDVDEALFLFAMAAISITQTDYAAHCITKLTVIGQMLNKHFFVFGLQATFEGTSPHREALRQFSQSMEPKIITSIVTMVERTNE